jgi:predicted acylesterase/phospholipase RssA
MDNSFDTLLLRTHPVRLLERAFVRALLDRPREMTPSERDTLMYAFSVGRLDRLRHGGRDWDLFDEVAPFRHWLVEQTGLFVDTRRQTVLDWAGLRRLLPTVRSRITSLLAHLTQQHVSHFSADRLESEITTRELVLVLSGGGGSGYSHMGTFNMLNELGITPRLIAGSSMGSLLGLFRSVQRSYDASTVTMALPRPTELGRVFSPYRGFSRFGFPGTLEMKARTMGTQIFREALRSPIPRLNELPIAFRPVVTGLSSGIGVTLSDIESQVERAARSSPFSAPQRASLMGRLLRTLTNNRALLQEVVFGSDEGLVDFNSVDAIGFSCAVPGVIHYDLYGERDSSIEALNALFAARGIFRLTDGGVMSNVPAHAAWRCVQKGEIITRNVFVAAFDCFAPQLNRNALFYPIQKIAQASLEENLRYTDLYLKYRNPPSPVSVLMSLDSIEQAVTAARDDLRDVQSTISAAMRRLPRWLQLQAGTTL